jgi:hypothetical protein
MIRNASVESIGEKAIYQISVFLYFNLKLFFVHLLVRLTEVFWIKAGRHTFEM